MSHRASKKSMRLVAEIPRSTVDPVVLAHLKYLDGCGCRITMLKGLITETIYISRRRPTKRFIRDAEAQELAAVEAIGGTQ